MSNIFTEIKEDLILAQKYSWKGFITSFFFNVNFQALLSYRIQHRIAKWPAPFRWLVLPIKLITEYLTSAQIHYGAKIAGGVRIHHCNGLAIGCATIGKGTQIVHDVTIGTQRLRVSEFPIIGENVEIYAGAKIYGNIKVGNNCIIGAGAVLNQDIPDYTVVYAPAPIIKSIKNANKKGNVIPLSC